MRENTHKLHKLIFITSTIIAVVIAVLIGYAFERHDVIKVPKPSPATKAQPLDQIAGYKCTVVSTAANEATLMETLVIEQSDDRGKTWWRYMMVPTTEGTNTYMFRSRAHTFYRVRFNKWSALTVPR